MHRIRNLILTFAIVFAPAVASAEPWELEHQHEGWGPEHRWHEHHEHGWREHHGWHPHWWWHHRQHHDED
jgi:hypothetical protein